MLKKSIGMRLIAFMIDFMVIFAVALIMYFIFGFGTLTRTETSVYYNLNFMETTIASLIYFLTFALLTKGRTVGKLITKVQVRTENLDEIELKQMVLRETMKSLFMIINFISFIVVLVRKDRKSLHDLIVGTIVVRHVKNTDFIEENKIQPIVEPKEEKQSV